MVAANVKFFSLLLLVSSVVASAPANSLAHPRQSHVKKFDLTKRQDANGGLAIGSSCADITGNSDDVICELSAESISCAPLMDALLETNAYLMLAALSAVPRKEFTLTSTLVGIVNAIISEGECGPRPTSCRDFGGATTTNGLVVLCPSQTPTCVTRDDGGAACTGADPSLTATQPTETAFTRPNGARISTRSTREGGRYDFYEYDTRDYIHGKYVGDGFYERIHDRGCYNGFF
ncbi:hypothetical protein ABW20_dc0109273 [Dactylellina cionopaga]|nr:hypothetical protein ABW20_dc0109273 [Dactylellina cionopaga]